MRKIALYAALSAFALLQLFPLLWLIDYSLVKSGELFGPEILKWPNPFQWGNYARAWIDGRIALYLWNSAVVVVSSVAASALF
jgi:raffinose/stachyose/melibiose transport system permease protein